MFDHALILELSGVLKAGVPARVARADFEERLAKMEARNFAEFETLWSLSLASGGSIASAMQGLSDSMVEAHRQRREMELAFAAPKATAKLVGRLPIFGLVGAQLVGLNPFGAIVTKPLAMICVALGFALLFLGRRWSVRILASAKPVDGDPGLYFDAVRLGALAGLPLRDSVDRATKAFESNLQESPSSTAVDEINRLAFRNRESGAALAPLLLAAAKVSRESFRFEAEQKIANLSVKLMIPLGLLTLPSFICLTIAPIAISLLSPGQNI
ncbi:MAG: hypothetical protein ACKOWI_02060 [Rhodoluna sp.]